MPLYIVDFKIYVIFNNSKFVPFDDKVFISKQLIVDKNIEFFILVKFQEPAKLLFQKWNHLTVESILI